jgi:hypothetical protein
MAVAIEPTGEALRRIADTGSPIISIKRIA